MQYSVNLTGGADWVIQHTAGMQFALLSTGVAASVEVRLRRNSETLEEVRTASRGFRARMDSMQFSHVELKAAVDCTVEISITEVGIDFDFTEGATVNAVIQGLPLAVSNDRGSPGNPMNVVGVTINDSPATGLTTSLPVAVTSAGASLASASAARREVRFTNFGPDPVAIGPSNQTWAKRAIVLEVGDTWVEDRGANLQWAGITDAGKTASVGVQGLTA